MPKKCAPGFICIENVTLLFLVIIIAIIVFLYIQSNNREPTSNTLDSKILVIKPNEIPFLNTGGVSSRRDTLNDPYAPPLKKTGLYHPPDSSDVRGIPVNIETRGLNTEYQQVGILTKDSMNSENLILPLMGRRLMSGRDKWRYYTMSNSGFVNTKLPISVNGKSCSGEYGCDEIMNGDVVFAEGYNDTFRATIYENSSFQYIPHL